MAPLLDVCLHLQALAVQMVQRPEDDLSYVEELLGIFGVFEALREQCPDVVPEEGPQLF